METCLHKLKRQNSAVLTLFVFILALIIAFTAVGISELYYEKNEKIRTDQIANSQVEKLQHVINGLLFTTRTVEALLQEGNGTIEKFDWIMEVVLKGYDVRNISLAPDGIVTQTYPYEGNESAIGHNLLEDPARSIEAQAAKDSRQLTLAGPYILRQGGFGAIGRLPIYLEKDNESEAFWGFVCVTLEFPQSLKNAQLDSLEKQKYSYELWRIQPDNLEKQIITRSNTALCGTPCQKSFSLPNSTWYLSLTPVGGWLNLPLLLIKSAIALIFAFLIALLYKNILELARNRNELDISIQQQAVNYKQMNQLNDELRVFHHDVKNHMLSLSSLLKKENITQAQEYIASISDTLNAATKIVNTENYIFDALLAAKIDKAREKNIQVESEVFINKQLRVSNTHWSILFGNALDNAIEACELVTTTPPMIRILIKYKGNILQVKISNTTDQKPFSSGGLFKTTKKDYLNHGIGLKNIRTVVKSYGGTLETRCEDGIFDLSFVLFDV